MKKITDNSLIRIITVFAVFITGFFALCLLPVLSQQNFFSVPNVQYLLTNVHPLLVDEIVYVENGSSNTVAGNYQKITPVIFTNDTILRDQQDTNYAWMLIEESSLFPLVTFENLGDVFLNIGTTNQSFHWVQNTNNVKILRGFHEGTFGGKAFVDADQGDDSPNVDTIAWLSLSILHCH